MRKKTLARMDVVLALLLVAALGLIVYGYLEMTKRDENIALLTQKKSELEDTIQVITTTKDQIILENETKIEKISEALEELEDDYRKEKNKNDDFEDQLSDLGSLLGDLDKLSKTDEELLQKYSKVYFLNENYAPADVNRIDRDYVLEGKDAMYFHADALPFLEDMIKDAEDDDIELKVVSAYRSFDHQHELKGQFTQVYGEGANTFSADQGYSEHQLGTTVDLTDPTTGGTYESFKDTEAYKWLLDNAYKYGFVESYPEGNAFYVFEPWHWRFVGTELARDLHRKDDHFYDWDQRKIDEYLLNIFD